MLVGEDVVNDELVQLQEATPSTLSNNPRLLRLLWQGYTFGINGRKPAKQFTPKERNMPDNKQTYYHRNLVWQTMVRLVRGGGDSGSRHHSAPQCLRLQQ